MKIVLFNILLLISIFIFIYLIIPFIALDILWVQSADELERIGFVIIVLVGYTISACLISNN